MALPRCHRLGGRSVFDYIYGAGGGQTRRLHGKNLVLRVAPPKVSRLRSALQPPAAADVASDAVQRAAAATELRFAVVISRKISKRAVVRNRLRRLLHRAFLAQVPQLRCGCWMVLSLKPAAASCSHEQVLEEWHQLLQRSGVRS